SPAGFSRYEPNLLQCLDHIGLGTAARVAVPEQHAVALCDGEAARVPTARAFAGKLAAGAAQSETTSDRFGAHAQTGTFRKGSCARRAILPSMPAATKSIAASTTVAPSSTNSPIRSHASAPATAARTLITITGRWSTRSSRLRKSRSDSTINAVARLSVSMIS